MHQHSDDLQSDTTTTIAMVMNGTLTSRGASTTTELTKTATSPFQPQSQAQFDRGGLCLGPVHKELTLKDHLRGKVRILPTSFSSSSGQGAVSGLSAPLRNFEPSKQDINGTFTAAEVKNELEPQELPLRNKVGSRECDGDYTMDMDSNEAHIAD